MTKRASNRNRPPHRRLAVATGVSLLMLTGAACGDDADATVSRQAFVTEVNALCEAEHQQVDRLFENFPENPTPEQMRELVSQFSPIIRKYRDDVRDVGAPSGDEARYRDYVRRLNQAVARYEAASTDAAKASELFNEEDDSLGRIERRLGLDVCASR